MSEQPTALSDAQRNNILVVIPIAVFGILILALQQFFGNQLEKLFLFVADILDNQTLLCVLASILIMAVGTLCYFLTRKVETTQGPIEAIRIFRFLIQVSPAAVFLVGLSSLFLCLLSLFVDLSRISPYRIALITNSVPSEMQPILSNIREKIRANTGERVELSPLTISSSTSDLLIELERTSRQSYDLVVIDHSKLAQVADNGSLRKKLSPYTLYVSLTPLPRSQLKQHKYIYSAYPDIFTQVYELNSVMKRRGLHDIDIVVSNTEYGRSITEVAPRILSALSNGSRRAKIHDESSANMYASCTDSETVSGECPELIAAIDPYLDVNILKMISKSSSVPLLLDHHLNNALLSQRSSRNVGGTVLPMGVPAAKEIITAFALAHAESGRPIRASETFSRSGDNLYTSQLIRFRDDGTAIYLPAYDN